MLDLRHWVTFDPQARALPTVPPLPFYCTASFHQEVPHPYITQAQRSGSQETESCLPALRHPRSHFAFERTKRLKKEKREGKATALFWGDGGPGGE